MREASAEARNYVQGVKRLNLKWHQTVPPLLITALLEKLSWDNPVKLLDLVAFLHGHNAESNQDWFEKLVQRTLPEQASEILGIRDEWDRVKRFVAVFSSTHFPLDDNYLEMVIQWHFQENPSEFEHGKYGPYAILRQGVPFELTGCTWEAMHELWDGDRGRNRGDYAPGPDARNNEK